jgi:hypothetical protein
MKSDRSKLLIPCYKDMDAYDLPEEFAHLQAQDMSKIGFINDVVRGIKKVSCKDEQGEVVDKKTVAENSGSSIAPLLERAFMFVEEGDFARADSVCEMVLNQEPKNATAYLCKLMIELQAKNKSEFIDKGDFENSINYQRIMKFGDENLKSDIEDYRLKAKANNMYEPVYISAIQTAEHFKEEFFALDYRIRSIRGAIADLESIGFYKDAQTKAKEYKKYLAELEEKSHQGGCYIATAVYGSYDCPQVWTLRRYRDFTLAATWYGRVFIRAYYAVSPTLVKWFGKTVWFKRLWKTKLDKMVSCLNEQGVENTFYEDRNW